MDESMFCFNTKGKRYAIGNTPLPRDKYKIIKESVLKQITEDLEKNKIFDWDIFNIGCGKQ